MAGLEIHAPAAMWDVEDKTILEGPRVNWKHVDGPLMGWAGEVHWLTLWERLLLALRLTTVDAVACERWPHLAGERKAARNRVMIDAYLMD